MTWQTPSRAPVPLRRVLVRAGITKRVSVHGLRRTFNNLSRQVAGAIVTRAITGHVTEEMTEHYSHVDERRSCARLTRSWRSRSPRARQRHRRA